MGSRQNGCVRFVARSHLRGQLPHIETYSQGNMLAMGQHVDLEGLGMDTTAVDALLRPGEFSLHHAFNVHGSEPNLEDHARVGIQIVYIPSDARPVFRRPLVAEHHSEFCTATKENANGKSDEVLPQAFGSATLVSGVLDASCGWELEPAPVESYGSQELANHARAMAIENDAYFATSSGRKTYHF